VLSDLRGSLRRGQSRSGAFERGRRQTAGISFSIPSSAFVLCNEIEAWRGDYNTLRPPQCAAQGHARTIANSLCGRSPAQTPAGADWTNTKNEDVKPEDLSLSV
jgi:hypothetical protein